MRPSYKVLTAAFMSEPSVQRFQKRTGITPEMLAAELLTLMDNAPNPRARDAIFSRAMGDIGIFTPGVDAFNRGTEKMLRGMGNRDATEKQALRMSEESRGTQRYVSPERIKFLRDVAAHSSLQQGLADKMRATDRHQAVHEMPLLPERARVTTDREDQQDRRAALMTSIAHSSSSDHVRLDREHDTLRDTLRASFELHEDIAAAVDPLADEALIRMSDSV